jgi:ABC-type multidrug transport system ATPase subunit
MPITRRDHGHSDGRHNKESPTYLLQWRRLGENNNISGYACSGELFAFLGVDEYAKSNILKTIAKGQQTDDTSSEVSLRRRSFSGRTYTVGPAVSLNGTAVISPSNFSLLEVDDSCNVYDCLSVLEALVFSAELRLIIKSPMPHPSELIALRLLTEMGMEDIAETRIADLLVWQRRMVSQRMFFFTGDNAWNVLLESSLLLNADCW